MGKKKMLVLWTPLQVKCLTNNEVHG